VSYLAYKTRNAGFPLWFTEKTRRFCSESHGRDVNRLSAAQMRSRASTLYWFRFRMLTSCVGKRQLDADAHGGPLFFQGVRVESRRQLGLCRLVAPKAAVLLTDAHPRDASFDTRDEARTTGLRDSLQRAADGDVELSFIRGRYEEDFVAALRSALAALADEQRLLLQLRYREELTSDQIAVVLKTSRVTAHRRVVAARDGLRELLRDRLRARLELSQTGLEQLMGLLSSSLVPALAAELRQGLSARTA